MRDSSGCGSPSGGRVARCAAGPRGRGATLWLDDGIVVEEVNPGITVRGVLAFDIPADAEPVQIRLDDSAFSNGVVVELG